MIIFLVNVTHRNIVFILNSRLLFKQNLKSHGLISDLLFCDISYKRFVLIKLTIRSRFPHDVIS